MATKPFQFTKEDIKKFKNYLQRADKNKVLKQLPQLHEEAFEKMTACNAQHAAKTIRPDLKPQMSNASVSTWG
jgi:hypothetical protein